jgi:2,3-dihydroxy-2,3-dihydrophenylpropionate dehydrogenase
MSPDVRDRSVVVTGGSSGIGRALVSALLELGAYVVVLDRDPPLTAHHRLMTVAGDVTDPDANRAAVEAAVDAAPRGFHAFVGNAGVHDGGARLLDLQPGELDQLTRHLLAVNVGGYLQGARAAAAELVRRGGRMVFTLSDAAFVATGVGAGVAYTVSKHAALGVVRSLAAELAPHVHVNAVAPGGVLTGLRAADPRDPTKQRALFDHPAELESQVRGLNPLGAMLTPQQLVPHYLFLLGEASEGLTGHVLRPDGGLDLA